VIIVVNIVFTEAFTAADTLADNIKVVMFVA